MKTTCFRFIIKMFNVPAPGAAFVNFSQSLTLVIFRINSYKNKVCLAHSQDVAYVCYGLDLERLTIYSLSFNILLYNHNKEETSNPHQHKLI